MASRKVRTLAVPFESWLYLHCKTREERNEEGKKARETVGGIERTILSVCKGPFSRKDGMIEIMDKSFGGCDGPAENAWEENRWTDWSIEDMKKILDKAGLRYEDGDAWEVSDM